MAIYHHSTSIVKRSAGKSAVAAAAYRAGDKLLDLKLGLTHDYTRKSGVDQSMILAPVVDDWITDRQQLWNKVEAAEKRYDAQLAREITLAIPTELSRDNQIALVRDYVQVNYVERGMIADINFHHLNGDNPHAHIMLTMRKLEIDKQGIVSFGNKDRTWNDKNLLVQNRENWAKFANKYLVEAGFADRQIDHRSNADRGIETIPQIHLGVQVAAMREQGIVTDRGNEYERIEIANNNIRERLERIYQSELATRDAEQELIEFDRQVTYPEIPKIPIVIHDIEVTPLKKLSTPEERLRQRKQERKDADLLYVAAEYPDLKQTPEYQAAAERAKIRHQERLKSMPKQVVIHTPATEPVIKKWKPTLQQTTDPQLVESILTAAQELGAGSYHAGNYRVQILGEQIEVEYGDKLAMVIDISRDTAESQLISLSNTLNQYESGLGKSIDTLLTKLEQQREEEREREQQRQIELQQQLEQRQELERQQLDPNLDFSELEPEISFADPVPEQRQYDNFDSNQRTL